MPLKRQKGLRIETRTLRTKLLRDGFNFQETNKLFSSVTAWFLIQIAKDPEGVDLTDQKVYYEPKLCSGLAREKFTFDIPQLLRRACLAKAIGIYKSWRANYKNWQSLQQKIIANSSNKRGKPRKKHKPPVLPKSLNLHASYYNGMFKEDTGKTILLKVFVEGAWKWVKFSYQTAPELDGWQKSTGSLAIKRDGSVWFNWVYERYQHILTAKVNSRDTSNTEAFTEEKVLRTNDMALAKILAKNPKIWDEYNANIGYHPGNLAITRSGKIINSGLNACRRIALKFAARYYVKPFLQKKECGKLYTNRMAM